MTTKVDHAYNQADAYNNAYTNLRKGIYFSKQLISNILEVGHHASGLAPFTLKITHLIKDLMHWPKPIEPLNDYFLETEVQLMKIPHPKNQRLCNEIRAMAEKLGYS